MMNPHLHGGKWSQEEELYASALIDAFKAGELPRDDIEEGTSLRKYLAKKLMCSPKRVSKKYEGTNYNGKQVYFRNRAATAANDLAMKAKLQILEHNFLRTLSETKLTPGQGPLTLPTMANAASELQMINQLQMQALTDTSRSMTAGLFSTSPSQLQAGIPSAASLPQASNLAGLSDLSARSSLIGGSNLLGNLQGGGANLQFGGLASSAASGLVPRMEQESELASIAARLNASNQLAASTAAGLPVAATHPAAAAAAASSSAESSLAQLAASRSLAEAAQLRQLEDSILARSQVASLSRASPALAASQQSSLDALVRRRSSAMGRPQAAAAAFDPLSSLAPPPSAPSMLDYLTVPDAANALATAGAPSATDLLGGAARARLLLHNTSLQEQQSNIAAMAAGQDSARRVSQLLGGAGVTRAGTASAGAASGLGNVGAVGLGNISASASLGSVSGSASLGSAASGAAAFGTGAAALGRAAGGPKRARDDEDQDDSGSSKRWRGPH